MMRPLAGVVALCGLAALAAGCGSSPPSRFYTLSAGASPSATPSTLSGGNAFTVHWGHN